MQRHVIKIAGQSGSGLVTTGEIFIKALKHLGFFITSDREYPSLIKGGHACFQIDFGPQELRSLSTHVDVVMAVDRVGLMYYLDNVKDGGIVVHGDERYEKVPGLVDRAREKDVQLVYLPERETVHKLGGNLLMTNMIMLGLTWRVLGFPLETLENEVKTKFASKPKLLAVDLKLIQTGYKAKGVAHLPDLAIPLPEQKADAKMLINGNEALALGAIQAGVRAYYAYPMSPSSSILGYLANKSHVTGMVVKQAEDEITAAQMAVGSMLMGTRALVGTSGGGYDLMTETVSLAGMVECPLVIIDCQRPGPATGLPTWTSQGDLNMVIHAGHGEFARVVIGCSDPESCYELIQHAMNIAEHYQAMVVVFSEKVICEARVTVDPFQDNIVSIERGLVTDQVELSGLNSEERYAYTESGISKRWMPGSSEAVYYSNSDEHLPDGRLTEEAGPTTAMMDKRLRKVGTIKAALPKPQCFGVENDAQISFVGWGSSKNAMRDTLVACEALGVSVNYLHYDYLWPFDEVAAQEFFANNPNVHLIEGNHDGQLGTIVEDRAGVKFVGRLLKYDGRAFFVDDVMRYINRHIGQIPLQFN